MFRALRVPLTSSDLSEILSRLEQTVAEQGEDMQGYVTEIMLTLEAAVDNLDVEIKPFMKELFLSTPNLHQQLRASGSTAGETMAYYVVSKGDKIYHPSMSYWGHKYLHNGEFLLPTAQLYKVLVTTIDALGHFYNCIYVL